MKPPTKACGETVLDVCRLLLIGVIVLTVFVGGMCGMGWLCDFLHSLPDYKVTVTRPLMTPLIYRSCAVDQGSDRVYIHLKGGGSVSVERTWGMVVEKEPWSEDSQSSQYETN